MSLICLLNDETLNAANFSPSEWEDLKLKVKTQGFDLSLPCCGKTAVPKGGSTDRCQHFSHKPNEACKSDTWGEYEGRENRRRRKKAPEGKHHLRVKEIVFDVAQKAGWHATLEATGASKTDDAWRADVLAEKDGQKVAFEVQTSPLTFAEYRTRQQRYRDSDVKCVWLAMITPDYSDEEIPVFELSHHKSLYVIDFPEFFSPRLLGLTDNYRGVPIGEFILLILQNKVLWNGRWMIAEDTLARAVLANRKRCLFFGGELPPEHDTSEENAKPHLMEQARREFKIDDWDKAKVSHKRVGRLERIDEQNVEPPQKAVFVETEKPTVMAGIRAHGFILKCSKCGEKTLSFTKLRIDHREECGSPNPECLFVDLVEHYKSLWNLVPEEHVRKHLGDTGPNLCPDCGTFQIWSPHHACWQSSLPVCLEFKMPVSTELINRKRSNSMETLVSPFPLDQFRLAGAEFRKWWFFPE